MRIHISILGFLRVNPLTSKIVILLNFWLQYMLLYVKSHNGLLMHMHMALVYIS